MFRTFEDVKENRFLNSLNHIAENFGLYGCYVKYNLSTDETVNGIYFLIGNSKIEVEKQSRNIEKRCLEMNKDINFLYLDCAIFRLTDEPDFATHQSIVDFCRHAEFIREIFKEHNVEVPQKIDKRFLYNLTNWYKEKEECGPNSIENIFYENMFQKYLSLQHRLNSEDYETRRQAQLELYSLEEKTTILSLLKSIFGRKLYPNFYSLEDLSLMCGTVVKHKTKAKYLKPLSKKLKEYPNVICWHSRPENQPTQIGTRRIEMFKKRYEDNNAIVCLRYSIHDAQIITKLLAEIIYPEVAERDVDEIMKDGNYISIGIRELDFEYFQAVCDKNNVEFGFNPSRIYYKGIEGPMNIVVNKKDKDKLDEILDHMAKEKRKYHSHNLGLPRSNVEEIFQIADLKDIYIK